MEKFLILGIFLQFFSIVNAKVCAFKVNGEPTYYRCPRNEYCCNLRCCTMPSFQFYQLWYYWLLVIFMFLICSGGGWWYRYWLQARANPQNTFRFPRSQSQSNTLENCRNNNTNNGRVYRQRSRQGRRNQRPNNLTRVTYNPASDTVMLHRMLKASGSSVDRVSTGLPPSYSTTLQEGERTATPVPSGQSLYELYGPPPSYETVMIEQGLNSPTHRDTHDLHSTCVNTLIHYPQQPPPPPRYTPLNSESGQLSSTLSHVTNISPPPTTNSCDLTESALHFIEYPNNRHTVTTALTWHRPMQITEIMHHHVPMRQIRVRAAERSASAPTGADRPRFVLEPPSPTQDASILTLPNSRQSRNS